MINSLAENPRTGINWRHFRTGCPNYRVRWFLDGDREDSGPIYQVYCLLNTPPETLDEQEKCLSSRTECWRLAERRRAGEADIPIERVRRRKPA